MALKINTSVKDQDRLNFKKDNDKKERINQKTKRGFPINAPMISLPIIAKIQPKINPVMTLAIKVTNFINVYYYC